VELNNVEASEGGRRCFSVHNGSGGDRVAYQGDELFPDNFRYPTTGAQGSWQFDEILSQKFSLYFCPDSSQIFAGLLRWSSYSTGKELGPSDLPCEGLVTKPL
jgi:hypothetical protein